MTWFLVFASKSPRSKQKTKTQEKTKGEGPTEQEWQNQDAAWISDIVLAHEGLRFTGLSFWVWLEMFIMKCWEKKDNSDLVFTKLPKMPSNCSLFIYNIHHSHPWTTLELGTICPTAFEKSEYNFWLPKT